MPSELQHDPLDEHMSALNFRHEILDMVQQNPQGDSTERPFIYSIRVVRPVDFSRHPAKFSNKEIQESTVPKGSLYHREIYGLDSQDVENILVQFVSGNKIEVKYAWHGDDRRKTKRISISA